MSLSCVDVEEANLCRRNSMVVKDKVYPCRKEIHCNKIRADCFVINVLNGEVSLSCPNEAVIHC